MQKGKSQVLKGLLLTIGLMVIILLWGADLVAILATGDIVALKAVIQRGGVWAPLISFALLILQAFVSPLPSVVIFIANSLIFGSWFGLIISWLGSLASALVCFALVRYLKLHLYTPPHVLRGVYKLIDEYQDHAVFMARLLPILPFDLSSYAFALTPVRLKPFLLGTALGQTPAIVFYSFWVNEGQEWYINLGGILVWTGIVSLGYYLWNSAKKGREENSRSVTIVTKKEKD